MKDADNLPSPQWDALNHTCNHMCDCMQQCLGDNTDVD